MLANISNAGAKVTKNTDVTIGFFTIIKSLVKSIWYLRSEL